MLNIMFVTSSAHALSRNPGLAPHVMAHAVSELPPSSPYSNKVYIPLNQQPKEEVIPVKTWQSALFNGPVSLVVNEKSQPYEVFSIDAPQAAEELEAVKRGIKDEQDKRELESIIGELKSPELCEEPLIPVKVNSLPSYASRRLAYVMAVADNQIPKALLKPEQGRSFFSNKPFEKEFEDKMASALAVSEAFLVGEIIYSV